MNTDPEASTMFLRLLALVLLGAAVITVVYILGRTPPTVAPRLGARGLRRKKTVDESALFAAFDPTIRLIAGWYSHLPLRRARNRLEEMLVHGGDWLGITADEFFAVSTLSSIGFATAAAVATKFFGAPSFVVIVAPGLGAIVPWLGLTGTIADRFKLANRELPVAIDLAALCMGAGLDFPGALRQIVDKTPVGGVLTEELGRVLQELELGRTRKQALEGLAERLPTESIRDFVASVIQAEEKGNPLSEALRIQASTLRLGRSVLAEERAARAAVLMVGPLMLIFAAIILVLLGPFMIKAGEQGFF